MDSKHSMAEHLRTMSALIRHLKATGNNLFDEQQVTVVIRSLPEPTWGQMKLVLTHKIISLLHTNAPISSRRTPHQQPMNTPSVAHTSFCVLMLIISYLIIWVFKVMVESLLLDMNFQVLVMLWGYIYFYVF